MRALRSMGTLSAMRYCSFIGAAYCGRIAPEELYPFPTSELPSHLREAMIEARSTVFKDAQATDVWGIMSPSSFGGLELSHPCTFDVLSQSASHGYAAVHDHAFLVTFLIKTYASKEHKGRFLPGMSDGTTKVAWAVKELHAPNDLAETRCTAELKEDNATITVNGTKVCHQTNPTAFLVLTQYKTSAKSGLACLWIEASTPGVEYKDGVLKLTNVSIGSDSVVVQPDDAYRACMTAILAGSHPLAASKVAALGTVTDSAAVSSLTYALESVGAALAANIERGVPDTFHESTAVAAMLEMCQTFQSHPASRYTSQLDVHSFSASTLAKAGACCGVEDAAVLFNKTGTIETIQKRTLASMGIMDQLPELSIGSNERKQIASAVNRFGTVIRSLAVRFGTTIPDRELALIRASAISMLLFSAAAVLSRAHRAVAGKLPTADLEHHLALYWAQYALSVAESHLDDLLNSSRTSDDAHARLSNLVLGL